MQDCGVGHHYLTAHELIPAHDIGLDIFVWLSEKFGLTEIPLAYLLCSGEVRM